jgi:serine/threonine-protein kinase RsbW
MASETPVQCSVVVESKPSAMGPPCRQILSAMKERGYSQDDVFAVHLALEEAFLNAIKHGNKMDPHKKVKIDFVLDQEKADIGIADEGEGFNPMGIPDPRVGENLYRPEGRGLLLIRAYMHVVEYNERGNRVRMIRYKNRPMPQERESASASPAASPRPLAPPRSD